MTLQIFILLARIHYNNKLNPSYPKLQPFISITSKEHSDCLQDIQSYYKLLNSPVTEIGLLEISKIFNLENEDVSLIFLTIWDNLKSLIEFSLKSSSIRLGTYRRNSATIKHMESSFGDPAHNLLLASLRIASYWNY